MEQDGYLYTVAGRGSFVAPETVLEEWCQVTQTAMEAGLAREELQAKLGQIYDRCG